MEYIVGSLALDANVAANEIWKFLSRELGAYEGQLGYRLPSVGVREKDDIPTFIILSAQFGVVLVDVVDEKITRCEDDFMVTAAEAKIYSRDIVLENFQREIETHLKQDTKLYNRSTKNLFCDVSTLLIFYRNNDVEVEQLKRTNLLNAERVLSFEDLDRGLRAVLSDLKLDQPLSSELIDVAISNLEGTSNFTRKYRGPSLVDPVTKTDFMYLSLNTTFKLDQTQRKISMQIPDGPQRIRGLAGTGKTVILSLKAALAHKDFPDFRILFLFNTQSMYPQIKDELISKYYINESKQQPDWSKLKVFHAWGGREQEGLYSYICNKSGLQSITFNEVRGQADSLGYIYSDLLRNHRHVLRPEFDIVLIDEAQDFSSPVFEVAYLLAKESKRIVWAYDEFQSLTDLRIPGPDKLFGLKEDGQPNIPNHMLDGVYPGGIEKDFILPNSYRNPRMTLLAAHGLALGLYRDAGIVDVIDDRLTWQSLGYRVISPEGKAKFEAGDHILVERPTENSRNILESLLREHGREQDLMNIHVFEDKDREIAGVVDQIRSLIIDDKVPAEEIIVVTLDTRNSKTHLSSIRAKLDRLAIKSIMPGIIERSKLFKEKDFVTLTTPFRAKGNEGNFVFVLAIEAVPDDWTFRNRNAIFVAITRSRGWTYLSGTGSRAAKLQEEISSILEDYPRFAFVYPQSEQLARSRIILSKNDKVIERDSAAIDELLASNKELLIEKLASDPELADILRSRIAVKKK